MGIIKLPAEIMKGIISKVIKSMLKKKFGCDIDLQINGLSITPVDHSMSLHLDIDASINNDDLMRIIKTASLQ